MHTPPATVLAQLTQSGHPGSGNFGELITRLRPRDVVGGLRFGRKLGPSHARCDLAAGRQLRLFLALSNVTRCKLAHRQQAWQPNRVRNRFFQRCSTILGVLAMLGALLLAPVSTPVALAMATSTSHAKASAAMTGEMPCHKPTKQKHCPECPQKMCADMAACLAKCFQSLSAPVTQAFLHGVASSSVILPGLSKASDGSLVPPLLRPPSV